MSCPHVTAFLSCSFSNDDKKVNNYFKSLCDGLNIVCKNVSDGYSSIPPDVARRMIEECKVVLAVIPRREQTSSGKWTMPSAVHEEITMAYALKKPTLMVIEEEVDCDGFVPNLGTFMRFDRNKLYTDEFIRKIITSLHELRLQAVMQHGMLPDQDAAGFYAEEVTFLVELTKAGDKPLWKYSSRRKFVFTRHYEGTIKNSAWAEFVPPSATEKIAHELGISASRADIKPIAKVIKDTPQQLEVGLDFEPRPQKDDWVEVDFAYSSPFLNAIVKSDLPEEHRIEVGGKSFDCMDGMVPIQATRELHIQFRFPSWYGMDKSSIYPFVGSYSSSVDYVVESEIKRWKYDTTSFGKDTIIDIRVESPLMRHVYGIAWNLLA